MREGGDVVCRRVRCWIVRTLEVAPRHLATYMITGVVSYYGCMKQTKPHYLHRPVSFLAT
jgi:hypothetical protein